jgi:hypothetical protein
MKQNQFMTILPLPPTLVRLVKQCKMILGKPANLMSHFVTHMDGVQLALMEQGDTMAKGDKTDAYIKEDKVTALIQKFDYQVSLSHRSYL